MVIKAIKVTFTSFVRVGVFIIYPFKLQSCRAKIE